MIKTEYGPNIIANGEGSTLNGWTYTNAIVNGEFVITDGFIEQAINVTDDTISTVYKLSYTCTSLRNIKSYFLIYCTYNDAGTIKKCTRLIPIQATGEQFITFEAPDYIQSFRFIIRGDLNIDNIKLQHDTGLNKNMKDAILEVMKENVISTETIHALNAWIKNLFVEYVETNMEALLPGAYGTERHFIRIIDEEMEFITATLSPTETEPLLIADPNGSGGKVNVFYTAINNHEDAYRYFTITNPKLVHKDLTDKEVDAFKVYVRKTLKEEVKMKIEFNNLTTDSGVQTVMPMMTWGQGTDTTGNSDNGKGFILKDDKGLVLKYVTQTGKTHQIRLGEDGIEGAGVGGNFKSLDHYSDGFVVNGSSKFKWVAEGLQKEDGTIIPISESGGNMP